MRNFLLFLWILRHEGTRAIHINTIKPATIWLLICHVTPRDLVASLSQKPPPYYSGIKATVTLISISSYAALNKSKPSNTASRYSQLYKLVTFPNCYRNLLGDDEHILF
jgi:hypothetical protein